MMNGGKSRLLIISSYVFYLSLVQFLFDYNAVEQYEILSDAARKRRISERIKWSHVLNRVSDKQLQKLMPHSPPE